MAGGQNSTVGIANRYGLEGSEFEIRRVRVTSFSLHLFIPTLGPIHPPVQWVPRAFPGSIAAAASR